MAKLRCEANVFACVEKKKLRIFLLRQRTLKVLVVAKLRCEARHLCHAVLSHLAQWLARDVELHVASRDGSADLRGGGPK